MSLHKVRPKNKKISKKGIFLNLKKQKLTGNRKILSKFFSPDLMYLKPNYVDNLEKYFKFNFETGRKIKYFFGFYRTSLLKRKIKLDLSKNLNLHHSLKEIEFCSILERRLDVLLFRLGFVPTIYAAKQLISHKKIKVNNSSNASFSCLLKKGDILSFNFETQNFIQNYLSNRFKNREIVFNNSSQIEINFQLLKIIILTNKVNLRTQTLHYTFPVK
jgi:ribosomal protein S4